MIKKHFDSYENISAEEFEAVAMEVLARTPVGSEKIRNRRLIANFGALPEVYSILWKKCLSSGNDVFCENNEKKIEEKLKKNEDIQQKKPPYKPKHLLWALHFMKTYKTEEVLASTLGHCDESTLRKWIWIFIEAIAALKNDVVRNF